MKEILHEREQERKAKAEAEKARLAANEKREQQEKQKALEQLFECVKDFDPVYSNSGVLFEYKQRQVLLLPIHYDYKSSTNDEHRGGPIRVFVVKIRVGAGEAVDICRAKDESLFSERIAEVLENI